MPLVTTLLQVPNQFLSTVVEEDAYNINIRTFKDITYISIQRDNIQLISNERVVVNRDVLLYDFQFNEHGNFLFFSNLQDYPTFSEFEVSVFFLYITKSEVEDGF